MGIRYLCKRRTGDDYHKEKDRKNKKAEGSAIVNQCTCQKGVLKISLSHFM